MAPGLTALFLRIDCGLSLAVALPWRDALAVELEREARLAPVAGAVFTFWPGRTPLSTGPLGAMVADEAGP